MTSYYRRTASTPGATMDDSERIAASGEWWVDPWWESAAPNFHFPVPLDRVQRGASVLRQHFDAEWYRRLAAEPRPNIVFPYLCLNKASWALSFIASLGERLERLQNAPGLARPIRALRDGDGASALLELEVAEGFAEMDYSVSFPREGGSKSPDILGVKDTLEVGIECKRLRDEDWEGWEEALMNAVSFSLPNEHNGREIAIDVALNPRLSQVRFGSNENAALNTAFITAIKEAVLHEVHGALKSFSPPHDVLIPEVASLRIDWKHENNSTSLSGMERSGPPIFRRLFQNAIFPALEQLPEGKPGVVVIYSKYVPTVGFFRLLFDAACKAEPERFSGLAAVVLCPLQTVFKRTAPTVFRNNFFGHSDAASSIADVFTRTFGATAG